MVGRTGGGRQLIVSRIQRQKRLQNQLVNIVGARRIDIEAPSKPLLALVCGRNAMQRTATFHATQKPALTTRGGISTHDTEK
jgi:hypothetical protein